MRLSPTVKVEFVLGVSQLASAHKNDSVAIPTTEIQLSSAGLHPSVI